jgi:hypothetical protein
MTSGLTGRDRRPRALSPAARTPATALVWAGVFVGSDTTVFRVEGSRLLQVFSAYLGIDHHHRQLPGGHALPESGRLARPIRAS